MEEKELELFIISGSKLGDIEESLEDALLENGMGIRHNVQLSGMPGTGKTARVNAWAKDKNIKLATFDVADYNLWEKEINSGNIDLVKQDISQRLSVFEKGSFILFLDNYQFLPKIVEEKVLGKIIDYKAVYDVKMPNGMRKLDKMLFTVVAETI